MTNFESIKYEKLEKIEEINFISTLQKIKMDISDYHSQIPNRIVCINLLRSICKFQPSYFFNFFWGIRIDFLKNCLRYEQNPKLQQISIDFLNEAVVNIFNEISYENLNDFIYWIYENVFGFLKNNNFMLKSGAEKIIKDMSMKLPNEAIIVCLIKSLNDKDKNILDFIFNCIELYFTEFASIGFNFDYVLEDLELNNVLNDKEFQEYLINIKKAFELFKNIYQGQGGDLQIIIKDLQKENQNIFIELIK